MTVVTDTDIEVDALKALITDAANVRTYASPPDGVIMRGIALGLGTRRELKDVLGFGYDVIEKCLERNAGEISSQMVGQIERFKLGPVVGKVEYICVDCGGPRSYGSGQRCQKCYKAKAETNKRPPRPELDANDLAHREAPNGDSRTVARKRVDEIVAQAASNGDSVIHESEKRNFEVFDPANAKPCGCGRPYNHGGRCAFRRAQYESKISARAPASAAAKPGEVIPEIIPTEPTGLCWCGRENRHRGRHKEGRKRDRQRAVKKQTKVRTEIEQPRPAELVEKDKKQDKIADFSPSNERPKQAMAQVQVMGGVKMHNEIEVRVSEMATWPAERISEFFDALANVIEIPQRPAMPKAVKRAWSKEFENDASEEGVTGITMLYLVSMLHDGMEDHEKQAVWTLIQYLKRMQAHLEVASTG